MKINRRSAIKALAAFLPLPWLKGAVEAEPVTGCDLAAASIDIHPDCCRPCESPGGTWWLSDENGKTIATGKFGAGAFPTDEYRAVLATYRDGEWTTVTDEPVLEILPGGLESP